MISLIDYINSVDENGKATGHGVKVVNEYISIINQEIVEVIASSEYLENIDLQDKATVKLDFVSFSGTLNFTKKIQQIINKLRNINKSIKSRDGDIVWFTNIDWVLYLYLALWKKKKKVIVTTYKDMFVCNTFSDKVKKYLIEKAIRKIDLMVATNKNIKYDCKTVYVPDFYFNEMYLKYEDVIKKNEVLMIGTMGNNKDIETLVDQFKNINMKLNIVGKFYSEDRYKNLMDIKSENVNIANRRLSDKEYYDLLSQYKYVVLPYKMSNYEKATSGILLESIFLNLVVIAPIELLEYNSINGVGYSDLIELSEIFDSIEKYDVINDYSEYKKENVKLKILNALDTI